MAKTFLKLIKDIKLQIEEIVLIPSRKNTKEIILRHIIVELEHGGGRLK
jgi:hypothetical protein